MHHPHHIAHRTEQARLRIVAAVGVLVIAAGFGLGAIIHTTSAPSSPQPSVEQIGSTAPPSDARRTSPSESGQPTTVDTPEANVEPTEHVPEPGDEPAEPEKPGDEPEKPGDEPDEPGDEPDPGIDPDLLPGDLTIPWPVPDPTPIPPVGDLLDPEPEPTPPSPCCVDPDLGLLAPDAIDPDLIGLLLPAVQA